MASGAEKEPVEFVGPIDPELMSKFHRMVSAYLGDTCDVGTNHIVISNGGKTWRRQTWYVRNSRTFPTAEACWHDIQKDFEGSSLCRHWREQNGREVPIFTES
jgi:hypothetical protein